MSRNAELRRDFAGEERLFRLPIGGLRAVQERCDCGPVELHGRFLAGSWRVDDVRETILQGLIGGGMEAAQAGKLVRLNFDFLPKMQFVDLADAIIMAELSGIEDEPPGETGAGEAADPSLSPAPSSASDTITA